MDWRSIETAPIDGTRVILYFPNGAVDFGYYRNHQTIDHGKVTYEKKGWSRANGGLLPLMGKEPEPTHWMPVPDGPIGFV
jgi:hypothetical protein